MLNGVVFQTMATVGPSSTMVTRIFQLRRDESQPSMSTTVVEHRPHSAEHATPHHPHARYVPTPSPNPSPAVNTVTLLTTAECER
jgi:hypothetical protein